MTAPTWCRTCGDPAPATPHTCDPFQVWWYREGSAPPLPGEDHDEHCRRKTGVAWKNGAFIAERQHDELVEYRRALQKIAGEDYRGNRSPASQLAHEVLQRFTR